MKRFLTGFILLTAPSFATDSFHLAENGKALAPVVIPADASDQTKAVATELDGLNALHARQERTPQRPLCFP